MKDKICDKYAKFICEQLTGGYFERPDVQERINKSIETIGEISRLLDKLPTAKYADRLYKEFFKNGFDSKYVYKNMHQLVQISLQKILENKAEIQKKLPEGYDLFERPRVDYLIQALIVNFSQQLNAAYGQLPQHKKDSAQDEFMYFRTSADKMAEQLNMSNVNQEWIQPADDGRISFLEQMWPMHEDNENKKNTLQHTIPGIVERLERYADTQKVFLTADQQENLQSIIQELSAYPSKILNDTESFFSIYNQVSDLEQRIGILKPKKNICEKLFKFASPSKKEDTLAQINADLRAALKASDPTSSASGRHIMQSYKNQMAVIRSDGSFSCENSPSPSMKTRSSSSGSSGSMSS